jgi:hypothetical protein
MKTLAELRMEVELGLIVYAYPQRAFVMRDTDVHGRTWYVFWKYGSEREHPMKYGTTGGVVLCYVFHPEWDSWGIGQPVPIDDCYASFDDMLANWPEITRQRIWGTLDRSRVEPIFS